MKLLHTTYKQLLAVLLLINIAIGLINVEYFYIPTAFAYYGFCIISFLFVIISSFLHSIKNNLNIPNTPSLLFGLWSLYILVHYFTNSGTIGYTIYFIALYFLLLKATILFSSTNFNFKLFFIGVTIIGLIESIYCVSQFLGWFKSQSELYRVTGSWNNPNVTAIFLALTIPVFLFLLKGKHKKILFSSFLIVIVALLLLKCRAAIIGAVLSTLIFYGLENNFISWIKNKNNRKSGKALLILSLLIIIPISSHLYNAKKASADGRKFIWKLSTQMITEKPLIGYGYGLFEKEYNLYQSNYIKNGKATTEELANAGPVIMPHNELLLNAAEGGIIGLIIMVFFFGSLLLTIKKRKNKTTSDKLDIANTGNITSTAFNVSYSGIISFIAMSMVNSTIQIVPIMCLFTIYAAIICSMLEPVLLPSHLQFLPKNQVASFFSKAIITSTSIYLLYITLGMAKADNLNKKASLLQKGKQYDKALQIMPDLEKNIGSYSDYWQNYSLIYLETQQYNKALGCLEKAKKKSSLPELYFCSGFCYYQLKQYPQAINEYETLIALYPSKFLYQMTLLQTYLKNKDFTKAISLSEKIIKMRPKIPSEKVNRYKNICRGLLRKLGVQKTKSNQNLFQKQSQLIFK